MTSINNNELISKLEKIVDELLSKNTLLEKRIELLEEKIENIEKYNARTNSIDLDNYDNEVILNDNLNRSFSFTNLHSPEVYIPRAPSLGDITLNPPPVMRQLGFFTEN